MGLSPSFVVMILKPASCIAFTALGLKAVASLPPENILHGDVNSKQQFAPTVVKETSSGIVSTNKIEISFSSAPIFP